MTNSRRAAVALAVAVLVCAASTLVATASSGPASISALWHAVSGPMPQPNGEQFGSGVGGVACPTTGGCIAVGSFSLATATSSMLVDTERAGAWNAGSGKLPSNGPPNDSSWLSGIACASTTTCDAVGTYTSMAASQSAEVDTITGGTATGATEVSAPATDAGSAGVSDLSSIACPSTTRCTAAGGYQDLAGDAFGFVSNGSGSTWSQGVEIPMPADAGANPRVSVGRLSCTAAGDCVVVGSYEDASGDTEAFVDTITSGVPATAVEVAAPSGAATPVDASLSGVSCTSVGTCTAVGSTLQADEDFEPIYVQVSGGAPGAAQLLSAPPGGSSSLSVIDCTATGICTASGAYAGPSSSTETVVVALSGGTWGTPDVVTPPSLDSTNPDPSVGEITCASSTACTLVESVHQAEFSHAAVASSTGGTWSTTKLLAVPSTIGSKESGTVGAISCPNGKCEAVGVYLAPDEDDESFAEAGSGLDWTTGTPLETPDTLGPYTNLDAISCPAVGDCVAAGSAGGGTTVFTESGGTWGLGVPASTTVDVGGIAGLSCPTTTWCLGVGNGPSLIDDAGTLSTLATPTIFGNGGSTAETLNLESVSCWSQGNCEAVGWYNNFPSSPYELAVADLMQNGAWATPIAIPAPSDEYGTGMTQLFGVSCVSAGNCAAVGFATENHGTDNSATNDPEFVESIGGAWQASVGVGTATSDAEFTGIACPTSISCVAVGLEHPNTGASPRAIYAVGQVSGLDATVDVVPPGGRSPSSVESQLTGASCWNATDCVAVGSYVDREGHTLPMSVRTVEPPGGVSGLHLVSRTGSSLTVGWKAPADVGTGTLSYRASTSRNGKMWSAAVSTTKTKLAIKGLASATNYHVRVVVLADDGETSRAVAIRAMTASRR